MAFDKAAIREGMTVRSSDGEKLGKVIRCGADKFEIEKGFFFPEDYIAGYAEITDIRNNEIHLASTKTMLKEGWSADTNRAWGTTTTGATTGYGADRSLGDQEVRVPLAEEELDVRKVSREAGEVRIHKDVVTETRDIPVTVRREEVRVERVPATGQAADAIGATGESTVVVPVREETVEVTKRPVVKEEIRVTKSVKEEQRNIRETVKREEADIDDETRRVDRGLDSDTGYRASSTMNEDTSISTGAVRDDDKFGV